MKITLFLMVISILQLSAKTHAQTITLNKVNVPLSEIFKAIRQQTEYDFVYSKKQVSTAKPVTITVKNAFIDEVLELCFQNQPLGYSIDKHSILITFRQRAEASKSRTKAISVKGKIINETGEAVSGATVAVINSERSTKTNDDGEFELSNVDERATLSISYIGYETKNLPAKALMGTIGLTRINNKLDEVQVIGYGTSTQRLATGSTSKITSKEIENQPVTNVLSALSGRMPGVFIQTTNGLPGGNINIQIRGKGSISAGNNPLFLIDGIPYDNTAPNATNTTLVQNNIGGAISPLNNLNPSDIESITVLKDADATSIYGSRGANGVVLITTKSAKKGEILIDLNLQQGVSNIAQKPSLLNLSEYLDIRKQAFANDNKIPSSDPLSPNYAPDLTLWSQTGGTDWVDYLFGNTAHSTDLQAKLSGGKNGTTFSISGNYRKENTILPGENSYQRGGMTSQIRHVSENKKFSLSASNQFTYQVNRLSNPVTNLYRSFLMPANFPLYLEDGSFNWYGSNILAESKSTSNTKTYNSVTGLIISYLILPDLEIKISGGNTKTTYDQSLIFPTVSLRPGSTNYSNFGKNATQSFILEPQMNYRLKLGQSTIQILAGATIQNRINDNQSIKASNYKLESLMEDLGSAGTIDSRTSNYVEYKYASAFGRLTYNLKDTYIFNATARRDGSSRFGPGNKYGNFGSVGAAVIFTNFKFFQNNFPFLSFGKLRASFGTTGNDQIGDYQYLSTYSSPGTQLYQDVAIVKPNRVTNAEFHWETTYKKDLSLDLGLVNERIHLSVGYFQNHSKDQLVNYTIPLTTGFNSYQANLPARIENNGWEVEISAVILKQKQFSWSSNFNLTIQRNLLKSFTNFESSAYASQYELGYDISRISGYRYLGVDPSNGKPQYAGQDGTVSSDPYGYFTQGKETPKYYGGFGNIFKYSNIDLSVFTQFVRQTARGGLQSYPGAGMLNNYAFVKNTWTPENSDSELPRATTTTDVFYGISSLNIFNTSYIRLKNISLSYNLPSLLLQKMHFGGFRIYLEGQNLFTIWNRKAAVMDPESGGLGIPSALSRNIAPLKTIVLGIQLTLK